MTQDTQTPQVSADGILLDIKGRLTMWKPNVPRLPHNLEVMLLFLSLVKSRSRQEATEADPMVPETASPPGQIPEMNSLNLLLMKEVRSSMQLY